jgi:BirA family biotin operon repressor/biotin-[acetyl-CoA-carboxylase] ligase
MSTKQKNPSNLLNDYHLLSFDTLDSTNEEGKRLAKGGGCHGAVIWAKHQTDGRGRLGRTWVSSEGNLFVSVLLQPEKPLAELSQLSFVAAVSVIESLEALVPKDHRLQCKWPNDILLNDRKLGGILLESFQTPECTKPWVVVGVGVNVDSFPPRTEFPATCLKEAGVELVSAKIILSRFIHHFIDCYNVWNVKGFAQTRKKWSNVAWGMDQRLCARLEGGNIEGICHGIDASGSLLLKLDNGKKHQVHAGDVFPVEMSGA